MMKMRIVVIGLFAFGLSVMQASAQGGGKDKVVDTTGFANVENKIDQFKSIVNDICTRISNSSSLDSVKQTVFVLGDIAGSIINDMVPIYDNFYALHPDQYEPVKNISDLSDAIIKAKDIAKAKKLNQKMLAEYNSLIKAK